MVPARGSSTSLAVALAAVLVAACRPDGRPLLRADRPLHLEDQMGKGTVAGSAVPADLPAAVSWHFGVPRPEWRAVVPLVPGQRPVELSPATGALRLALTPATAFRRGLSGGLVTELPGRWSRHDWSYAVVEARAEPGIRNLTLVANLRRQPGETAYEHNPFSFRGETVPVIADGRAHRYLLRADWGQEEESEWRQLGLMVEAARPAALELLSFSLVPKEASYARAPAGVVSEPRQGIYRRALYLHAPGRLTVRLAVPAAGRLDFALGVVRGDAPVAFRVTAAADGREEVLFAERWSDPGRWGERSVDLSRFAGREIDLTLAADGPRPGTVALWGTPIVSGGGRAAGSRRTVRSAHPNVILYVIDAGGALYTSAYGANRRTTPNLERLAAEGALFERAYSNSTWSKPSTTSFMTGLQHAVLGGYENPSDPLPEKAETMAEILHRQGYQTAVFTSNTWCGTMSGLDRGVDVLRETLPTPNSLSSSELLADFWRWRDAAPGEPYWVHFQTTDVHWPWQPVPGFAGTFLSRREWAELYAMEEALGKAAGVSGRSWGLRAPPAAFAKAGIDRARYFELALGAYQESLAHNDFVLGQLVAGLEARGEREDTLLIVTADHGDWPGLGAFDAFASDARVPFFEPYLSRVPLVAVWPGTIAPGLRLRPAVSLVDLLPTVLDLAHFSQPARALDGQSLAPLLRGRPGFEPRPVILEEMNVEPQTQEVSGAIEIVDGRWGASLALGAKEEKSFLLYDLIVDPFCLKSVDRERPELSRHYRGLLESRFREHRAKAKSYRRGAGQELRSEQIETLKALGYVS
jgi:arylsulfatase A-like enzyme